MILSKSEVRGVENPDLKILVQVGGVGCMSSQRVPQAAVVRTEAMGKSCGSPDGLVQDQECGIRDLKDLPAGSEARSVRVPAKPVAGIGVQGAVEHI